MAAVLFFEQKETKAARETRRGMEGRKGKIPATERTALMKAGLHGCFMKS
jgi:hypothetical protein